MRVEDALANNLAWYRAMMDAHGLPHHTTDHHWCCDAVVPPYYSNFVTRTGIEGAADQLARITALASHPPKPVWSVADSFASLDREALEALGLHLLFDAHWFGLAGDTRVSDEPETDTTFEAVRNADMLIAWEQAWQRWSPAPGQTVFPPALLSTPGVTFWIARRGSDVVGGTLTYLHADTIGLSNVFLGAAAGHGAFHRDAARTAHRAGEGRAVVGYGAPSDLTDLAPLGFERLGTQRVWISNPI